MEIVTLDILQLHCNSLPEDAALLELYADAAEEQIQIDCDKALEELRNTDGSFPAKLVQAVCMLVAHWYRVRESYSGNMQNAVPMGYSMLIQSFRRYRGTRRLR